MIKEFSLDEFTRLIVRTLEESSFNVTTSNPDIKETYPVTVISLPMEQVLLTDDNNTPIRKRFSISIEHWSDKKYKSMEMYNNASIKLRELNLLPSGNTSSRYDEITKKHIFGSSYEVFYNGLTNSLEKIK